MRRTKSVVLPGKVTSRKWLWLGSGVFVAIGLVMVAVWAGFPRKKQTITAILSETGYFEVVPPSTFGGPGTINTIEYLSNGRLELHPTCDVDPALLASKIQKSRTVDRDLKQTLEKKLDVSAEVREKLSAVAGMQQVEAVNLKLENANILLISDESLISARNALLKAECEDAVAQNVSSGGVVCQTRSVLEADVVYEIKYHNKISMEEKAKLTSEIAAKLDLDVHQGADDKVSGSQLFFGIRLSPNPIVLKTAAGEIKPCSRK
ncbi:hypothetical protein LUI11_16880 [Bradyrhizobium diazoefficiens]|nr:hypothetical protein [Bradyrhizobium diazoefficiens]APO50039.1 hypothetical protein BD122_07390 [Bradyrhizobium diazoefficiens]KOY07520.1 hypothetical protein AF336_26500 [Bradyrhizobium diazoefficiens]MCD9294459.1 hypothetical protein [Bradyrhizobium diazoefficiens]MCD9810474.1 hypothetical protein [Bradyrhizobium diazoefficiens]MCD9884444.1 hypothetical protein [Bradyrhizobium diazoefficiens]